jgi:hypothetical protein
MSGTDMTAVVASLQALNVLVARIEQLLEPTTPTTLASSYAVTWDSNTTVAGDTISFPPFPWASGTITAASYFTNGSATPSFTFAVKINGTVVTGLSAVTVSSATPATTTATGANALSLGAVISLVISGISGSPSDAAVGINFTRSWT